tara:strand:+ start:258 stop:635 length:378 start_codon:yes stop_codon:yes gene_type:complete
MIAAFIPAIIGLIGKGIDKAVPDKDEAERLKAQITMEAMKSDGAELQAATSIILAEANGESWLQRNWRPLLMLWFAALVGAHWLGFTPENLSDAVVQDLLGIVQVGIGGYVLGRSAEKVVKEYKR